MKVKENRTLTIIFEAWRLEDRNLQSCVDEVRDWMQQVSQLGIPHFGETATRLRPLKARLEAHFSREDEMVAQLARLYPPESPEVEAMRRQSDRDHQQLMERLDDLIQRLDQTVPPFASWQAAINEAEMFFDVLEQHEDQESESFEMLMPSGARRHFNRVDQVVCSRTR